MGENKGEVQTLQEWFKSQQRFKTRKEFSIATGLPRSTLGFYIQGVRRPLEEHRKILYEITGLDCFISEINTPKKKEESGDVKMEEMERKSELPLNIQLQKWFDSQTKYKTKKDLAVAAGIGYSNLSKYFRGESQPSMDIREKLYEITGLKIFSPPSEMTEEKGELEQLIEIKTPSAVDEKVTELQKMISSYKVAETESKTPRREAQPVSPAGKKILDNLSQKSTEIHPAEPLKRELDKREPTSSCNIELLLDQIKVTIQTQNLKIHALEEENKNLREDIIDYSGYSEQDRIHHIERLCNAIVEQVSYFSNIALYKGENRDYSASENSVDFMINALEKVRESGKRLWDIEISEKEKDKFYLKVKDTIILLDRLTDKLFKGRKKLIPQGFSTDMLQFLSKTMDSGEKK